MIRSILSGRIAILSFAVSLALLAGCPDDGTDGGPATDSAMTPDSATGTDAATTTDGGPGTPCGNMGLECSPPTELCVIDVAFMSTFHCEPIPPGCDADRTCACVAATVCVNPFNFCTDDPADDTVSCECPTC